MWTIQQLSERFTLSQRQVRLRLTALNGLLTGLTSSGENNKILLSDAGIAIFERLMMLEEEGHATSIAVGITRQELSQMQSSSGEISSVNPGQSHVNHDNSVEPPSPALMQALQAHIQTLEHQIEELKVDKLRLWDELEEVKALPADSKGRKNLSRFAHLKAALFGSR